MKHKIKNIVGWFYPTGGCNQTSWNFFPDQDGRSEKVQESGVIVREDFYYFEMSITQSASSGVSSTFNYCGSFDKVNDDEYSGILYMPCNKAPLGYRTFEKV